MPTNEVPIQLPNVAEVKKCLRRVQDFLESDFVRNAEGCGWYHFLREGRVGILGTAAGIVTLSQVNAGSPYVVEAAAFLVKSQLASSEPTIDGGWSIASIGQVPICESTTWCTLALCEAGMETDRETVGRAIKWLISNQNPEGGWGAAKSYRTRVYPTSMAIRTMQRTILAREYAENVRQAVKWLLGTQNNDGGWGEYKGAASTPIHTAHAILGLLAGGIPPIDKSILNAVDWLYKQQDDWNSHLYEAYEIGAETTKPRVRIDHVVLPWVVTALIEAGENINHVNLKLALSQMVYSQHPDGVWKSGVSERISIFETQDNVIALSHVLSHTPSLELTLDIQERLFLLEREFSRFLPTIIALSGAVQEIQRVQAFYRKYYWFLTVPLFFGIYSLIELLAIRLTDWRDFVLYGLAISATLTTALANLRITEKVAFILAIVLGSLSIRLFNYSSPETVASVLFAAVLSIAVSIYEKYRK